MKNPQDDDTEMLLTAHALERIEERNLDGEAIEILFKHGDLRLPTRDGCSKVRLSRRIAKRLDCARAYPRRKIELAREMLIVVAPDSYCVTAWKCPTDHRFRRSGARPTSRRGWRSSER